MKDQLPDLEQAAFYKRKLKLANRRMIFFVVLAFIIGFVVAREYYIYLLAWKRHT